MVKICFYGNTEAVEKGLNYILPLMKEKGESLSAWDMAPRSRFL